MTTTPFFPCTKHSIADTDSLAVREVLSQSEIACGPKTAAFEQAVANSCDASYAVSFNSATTALYAAFHAAKVTTADRFITTPNTFIATAAAGMRLGLNPIFVDLEKTSGNLSRELLKNLLDELPVPSRGRWIFSPVHFAGVVVDMRAIDQTLRTPDVVIIEDATHALGALYPSGEKVGSCCYSQLTVFSFDPTMAITTGEGGAVTTNDPQLYRRLLTFRNNGIEEESAGQIHELGGNYHITEMQAALGLSQLERLEQFLQKRRQLATRYRQQLKASPNIELFPEEHDARSAHHFMVVKVNFAALKTTRSAFMKQLYEWGIESKLHYTPVYRFSVYEKKYGDISEQFPEMEGYYQTALSLPLYYDLEESDIDSICDYVKKLLNP